MNITVAQKKINIAIVDDHIAIREGYTLVISRFDFVNEIFSYSTPADIYNDIVSKDIQLILMDIEMKNEDGIASCSHIKSLYPSVKILIVSGHHSETYIMDAYNENADGYFFKDLDADELKKAMKLLMDGQRYYHQEVQMLMFERHIKKKPKEPINLELSPRESEILEMICKGKSIKQIADLLYRSENTINTHKYTLMKKIGVHREADIIQFGIKAGIVKSKAK